LGEFLKNSRPTMAEALHHAPLPTPVSQSQQGGMRLEGGSGARKAMKDSGLYDLFREKKLPTPMASDGMKDGAGGGAGSTYPLRMILATPRKSDADRGGRGDVLSQLQGHASRHAGMMPTPVKPNGGRRLSRQEIESGRRMNGAKAQIDTPNLLRHAAENLPTPTKRDSRMDGWSPAYERRKSPTMDAVMSGAMKSLTPTSTGNQTAPSMQKWAGARALAAMLRSHGLTGTAALPITYGWMMGFPPGWLTRALRSAVEKGLLLPV
jgi:hypothetical protein|tara:strand:- start:64 stop:858 length:795 start_codon:yes stop_codon:yes gene_type:complete